MWLKEAWIEWLGGECIWELYAGTEAQATTVITGTQWLEHRGSVGRPITGEVRILDADGRELPPGEVGEVYLRRQAGTDPTYRYIGAEARARGPKGRASNRRGAGRPGFQFRRPASEFGKGMA